MKRDKYLIFVTLLYFTIVSFLNQILIYNVTLENLRISSQSIFWLLSLVYGTFIIFKISKNTTNVSVVSSYVEILKGTLNVTIVSLMFLVFNDLIVVKEINIVIYIKFVITLVFVFILLSLVYFLEKSFRKYRVLWIIGFVGTIILSPLLVESGMFIRDLRFKSLLDFWNWIVPYQWIEQLRHFVLLEGWQGWDVALMTIVYLLIYWFVVASICLYVRQFQVSWK